MKIRLTVRGETRPIEFGPEGGTIGRSDENDLRLADPDRVMSRKHARIAHRDGRFVLEDLSKNGTFLNQSPSPIGYGLSAPLSDGDLVRIGPATIVVQIVESTGEAPANDPFVFGLGANDERDPFADPLADFDPFPPDRNEAARGGPDHLDDGVRPRDHPLDVHDQMPPIEGAKAARTPDWLPDWLQEPGEAPAAAPSSRSSQRGAREDAGADADTADASRGARLARGYAPPGADDLFTVFLESAGLSKRASAISAAEAEAFGAAFRSLLYGVLDLMTARGRVREELRANRTMLAARDNNPLKVARSAAQLIEYMFASKDAGFLPIDEAAAQAIDDLKRHDMAVMAGVQAGVDSVFDVTDPDRLSEAASGQGNVARLLTGVIRQQLRAEHEKLRTAHLDREKSAFWRAFVNAYARVEDGAPSPRGPTARRDWDDQ